MKKRFFALTMACALAASSLAGCGGKTEPTTAAPATTAATETKAEETKAEEVKEEETKAEETKKEAAESAVPESEEEKKEYYSDYSEKLSSGLLGRTMAFGYEENGTKWEIEMGVTESGNLGNYSMTVGESSFSLFGDEEHGFYSSINAGENVKKVHVSKEKLEESKGTDDDPSGMLQSMNDGGFDFKDAETKYLRTEEIDGVKYDVVEVADGESISEAFVNTTDESVYKISQIDGEMPIDLFVVDSKSIDELIAEIGECEEVDAETFGMTFGMGMLAVMAGAMEDMEPVELGPEDFENADIANAETAEEALDEMEVEDVEAIQGEAA